MNKILTTSISDPTIGQPLTGKSLEFLQNANKESIAGVCEAMIGSTYSTSLYYVLSGLQAYGTNQYYAGYIYHNGELYYSAGKSTTTAFSNIAVMTLAVSNDATADPLTFTDNVARNVHNVRRMVLSDAVSGSGTVDLRDCYVIYNKDILYANYTTTAAINGGAGVYTEVYQYTLPRKTLINIGDSIYVYSRCASVAQGINQRYMRLNIGGQEAGLILPSDSALVGFVIKTKISRVSSTSLWCEIENIELDVNGKFTVTSGIVSGSFVSRQITVSNMDSNDTIITLGLKTDGTTDSVTGSHFSVNLERKI